MQHFGSNILVQWDILPSVMLASYMNTSLRPSCSISIQLPAHVPRKAMEDNSISKAQGNQVGDPE